MNRLALLTLLPLLLTACAEKLHLKPASYTELPGWQEGSRQGALKAFARSCGRILKKSPDASLGPIAEQAAYWQPACKEVLEGNPKADFFETHFTPLKATSNKGEEGLYTGYYEIALNGSKKRSKKYAYPLYRKPPEGDRTFTRAEIDAGALEHKGLELVWVDDPVRLFFLHIQGSGVVQLAEGGVMRVGYDGQNGQPYSAIGRYLIHEGYMEKEDVTAPAIKQWLYDNPDLAQSVMQQNPSYIYFRELTNLEAHEGPIGAEGVPIEPLNSLAVDRRFFGYGIPMWLETSLPETADKPESYFTNLFIAQDTGGAIRGAIRGDVFFGRGQKAEQLAGNMKQPGRLWVLLPNELAMRYAEETDE